MKLQTTSRLAALVVGGLIAVTVPMARADLAQKYSFSIQPQSLSSALIEFSKQADVQVVGNAATFANLRTEGLSGEHTGREALARLIGRLPIMFEEVTGRAVRILPRKEDIASSWSHEGMKVAQGESAKTPDDSGQVAASSASEAYPNANKEPARIEEVVVTAQKREERLQDVPISMTVLGGAELDSSTLTDVTEALRRVPGVVLNEIAYGGFTQVPIRGVASQTASDSGASPTAYYLDSVPFGFVRAAFAPSPDAYDLERVEVLRGPQGTLYGANALNGVVRVLTKDATLDAFEFKARASTSSTEYGGWNYRGDLAANVPIVDGKLAARAVLGYQDLSGWIDKPNDKGANDMQRRNLRLKVNAQPTEELSIGLSAWSSRSDQGAPSSGSDSRQNSSLVEEPIATDYDAYGLKLGYEFPLFSFTSMTSYLEFDHDLVFEIGDRGTPNSFLLDETYDAQTFAQEFALSSTQTGSWRWSAGAMYRDSKDGDYADLLPIFATPYILQQQSESYAVFGELTRLFSDGKWEFTAGLRYFKDDATQTEKSRWLPFDPAELLTVDAAFTATTPRFILAWHPSEQMTAYASYAEGFRSGFHQFADVLVSFDVPPIGPDRLTNYEVGAKGSLLNGRLSFDSAVYFIDWQDVQQSLSVAVGEVFLPAYVNGESASGVGIDFGLTATPIEALQLGLNFSWNDLTLDQDVSSFGAVLYEKGARVNNSAELTIGTFADYLFPLGRNGLEGRFSISANYTSEQESRGFGANGVVTTVGSPLLIAATAFSIEHRDRWTARLFIDNLNNEQEPSSIPPQDQGDLAMRIRPRTIGLQLEYRY